MSFPPISANPQLALFSSEEPLWFDNIITTLPPLPKFIRYYCDFDDNVFTINNFDSGTSITASVRGAVENIDLNGFSKNHTNIIKQLFMFALSEDKSIGTAMLLVNGLRKFSDKEVFELITAGPLKIKSLWMGHMSTELGKNSYFAAKTLLLLCCRYRIFDWSESYCDFISTNLPFPYQDKFSSVRSGEALLVQEEEASIISYLDKIALNTVALSSLPDKDIIDTAMILCAFQFGMRPIQIAMLSVSDVRIWPNELEQEQSVHLTFRMVKQRTRITLKPLQRKVKYEWASIFVELYRRAQKTGVTADTRIFGPISSRDAARRIAQTLSRLVGRDVAATDLRHTAAQRLVDAGASQEELAEFMGHTDVTTGLVYFRASANQAALVNRALGASEIYQRVARIAHDRFISADELSHLKGEQQIGGVPHGIPIAGIGGCSSGQPSCPFNPITSCYGCPKFMPLHDIGTHEQVLADFREVVRFFHDSSRGDQRSPAYLQLQRTIAEVQTVIAEIKQGAA